MHLKAIFNKGLTTKRLLNFETNYVSFTKCTRSSNTELFFNRSCSRVVASSTEICCFLNLPYVKRRIEIETEVPKVTQGQELLKNKSSLLKRLTIEQETILVWFKDQKFKNLLALRAVSESV